MAVLSKAALLAATELPIERITVAELGGELIIRGMSGTDRDGFEKSLLRGKGRKAQVDASNFRAKLLVQCIVDEQGARIFTDADADALGKVRADILEPIFDVARKLSGLSEKDVEELGKSASEEAPAPGVDSPSA